MQDVRTNPTTCLRRWLTTAVLGCIAAVAMLMAAPAAQAEFGLAPDSFFVKNHEAGAGTIPPGGFNIGGVPPEWFQAIEDADEITQAGAHPNTTASFSLNLLEGSALPDDNVRDVIVDLPAGFVGNPQVAPVCMGVDFYATPVLDTGGFPFFEMSGNCTVASQVGLAVIEIAAAGFSFSQFLPIYSLAPPPGTPARYGFKAFAFPIVFDARVRSDGDYGLSVDAKSIPTFPQVISTTLTMWGVPYDSANDPHRWNPNTLMHGTPATGLQPKPFLTTPSDCDSGEVEVGIRVRSWQNPDSPWITDSDTSPEPTGCDQLAFGTAGAQAIGSAALTNTKADSPTGLEYQLELPFSDDPTGLSRPPLRDAKVELPEGMTINPSAADGLDDCSPAEIGLDQVGPPACPPASKIGSIEIETPLLADPLKGSVFQAEQTNNPFDSTLAMYLHAEGNGVQVKLPGLIAPDQSTGKLTVSFNDNPQLPFTNMTMRIKGGNRAPLTTPSTCGTYSVVSELAPWSGGTPAVSTSTLKIDKGPDGGACLAGDANQAGNPADKANRPFNPAMNAGVQNPSANSHSPFSFKLSRPDGHQELGSLNLQMPEGVTAKLAGVDYCPDNVLNAISKAEGTGAAEATNPSCPANSQIGTATVGVGAGPSPHYVQTGKAYLAGPYKGAQLSLAVVVPALAGPFDLGTEVVRNKLDVDPRTAQIGVESDPLPQILHGIPLKIRDLRVNVNREGFMLSPTDCSEKQINAEIQGSHGKSAALTNRFQVGDCASLGFSPKLKLDFGKKKKNTKPNAHPPLNAKLSFNEGDANIKSVKVALPQGLLLDQERLGRICSRANYAANTCPEESRVGYAKATTPLLDDPVEGPVYLKASDNPLPDLAADLNGQIDIDLFGKIDQKQNKKGLNQIRNTFDVVPDVPVSGFQLTLDGGSDGLLVNSRNICKSKSARKVSISMRAHNEMSTSSKPLIGSACKNKAKKKPNKGKGKKKGKRGKKRANLAAKQLGR